MNEKNQIDPLDALLSDMGMNQTEQIEDEEKPKRAMSAKTKSKRLLRRATSEIALLDALPRDFEDGCAYHVITQGDVDALSYLKAIMRAQPLDYLLFSTWCMADDDCDWIGEQLDKGNLKKVDGYLGEIFPKSYSGPYQNLQKIWEKHRCGRLCVFRNHSKIFAGQGPKFAFVVEMSCNINTNPRTEQGVITIDKSLFNFYKEWFDGVNSFTKGDEYYEQTTKD
jgi:hypothetical protein